MKVLIFLEAFPLRNRLTGHLWLTGTLRHLFAKTTSGLPDDSIRVFCGSLAADKFLEPNKDIEQNIIPFSESLNDLYFERSSFWINGDDPSERPSGIESWTRYIQGEDKELRSALHTELARIKATEFDFDCIAYWGTNGNLTNNAIAKFLPGVKSMAMELGPTRAPFVPSLAVDSNGVNGDSTIARLTCHELLGFRADAPSRLSVENAVHMENGRTLYQSKPPFLSNELAETFLDLRSRYDRVVLFANQLADDANSILFGNGLTNLSAIERVCEHPAMKNGVLIVKPHPKSRNNAYNARAWDKLRATLRERFADQVLIWDKPVDDRNYLGFLNGFDAVTAINSSVLFEAALMDRPVAPLGRTGFFPSDAHDWLDAALGEWGGEAEEAARLSVALNVAYLLPRRSTLQHRQVFLSVAEDFSRANKASPADTLRTLINNERRLMPKELHLVHWVGHDSFARRGLYHVPGSDGSANVTTYRNGFSHLRFSVVYEDRVTPKSVVGEIEAFGLDGNVLTIKVSAVSDMGLAPMAFIFKSAGKVMFARPNETRPARALAQGFPSNTRIGATIKIDLDRKDFPIYGGFELMAVASGGKATRIEVPTSLRRVISDRIRWQAAEGLQRVASVGADGVTVNA